MTSCEKSCKDSKEYVDGYEKKYNKDVKNHCDLTYDEELEPAMAKCLVRLPWIGKSYRKATTKVLIVAESHYANSENNLALFNREFSTRLIVWESRITDDPYTVPQYNNLERVLTGIKSMGNENREDFWEHVAFYNFIQRTMYPSKERPNWNDFIDGWGHCIDVVKVLKPDVCLFSGVTASKSFDGQMQKLGISYAPVKRQAAIASRVYPRVGAVNLGNYRLPLVFIKHCSSYFSWPTWYAYLRRTLPNATTYLHEVVTAKQDR